MEIKNKNKKDIYFLTKKYYYIQKQGDYCHPKWVCKMKILFICTGNTCRSPMAEAIARKKYPNDEFSSCGLCAFPGDSATKESIEAVKSYGIDLSSHRARAFSSYMLDEYDLFAVMTPEHYRVLSEFVSKDKLVILGDGIPDPYGRSQQEYNNCAKEIEKATDALMARYSQIEIRPMTYADTQEIALIEKECFSTPWSRDGLISELSNDGAVFLTAVKNGEIAGYMGMHIVLDECYIANVAVKGEFRRQGIAQRLLDAAEKTAEDKKCAFISLEVRVSNTPAIALYEKRGYVSQGERKNFYSNPTENALIMTKNLDL